MPFVCKLAPWTMSIKGAKGTASMPVNVTTCNQSTYLNNMVH